MTARVTVTDREVTAALAELARLGRDPSAPLKAIGQGLIASTGLRARSARAPDGTLWPMLSPEYAASKRGSPLRESGALLGGLSSEVSGRVLRVGSDRPYAAIHQFGGTITPKAGGLLTFRIGRQVIRASRVRIPARPWLGISADDRKEILGVLSDHIRRATRQGVR